jgi:hypothetical protein
MYTTPYTSVICTRPHIIIFAHRANTARRRLNDIHEHAVYLSKKYYYRSTYSCTYEIDIARKLRPCEFFYDADKSTLYALAVVRRRRCDLRALLFGL